MLDLPVDPALAFLQTFPSGTPLTLTHYVTKVAAYCLKVYPDLNHVLRLGNLYERKQVDIFISTLLKTTRGKDLSGFVIRDVNSRSLAEVANITQAQTDDLRHGRDEEHRKVQQIVNPLPSFILRPLLLFQDFMQYVLNMSIPFLATPKDRFGSAMITNIGSLGIENAFIPLSPYTRCPLIVGIGKPREIPIVLNGQVIPCNSAILTFTFDHRYADGANCAPMIRRFKKVFLDPSRYRSMFEGKQVAAEPEGEP